jgi:hypothetical protein
VKIAFLCASLEPGRDGVGDYTRSLATACAARGHDCALLALHDSHLVADEERLADDIPALRLSPRVALAARLANARACLADFAPDWVSWQFVSYGYHPKGLVGAETRALATLAAGRRTHVMLHELWIGIDRHESWKNRFIGGFQRRGLLALLHRLRTQRLHTSNAAYRAVLARHHWSAELLPLFGNLPVAAARPAALSPFLPRGPRENWLVGATFGTLHPQWQPEATADLFHATAARLGRTPLLLACGRTGGHGAELLRRFAAAQPIAVVPTGEQSAETLSQLFQTVDFGIAPHPWALIGKSGAAAAMLDHGLPVLVPRDDWAARPPLELPVAPRGLLVRLADLTPEIAPAWLRLRRAPNPALPRVADSFLEALGRA